MKRKTGEKRKGMKRKKTTRGSGKTDMKVDIRKDVDTKTMTVEIICDCEDFISGLPHYKN